MSTDTVLTDEQVGDLYQDWHCFFKDNPGGAALCVRAIEQAVLQSPEVQARMEAYAAAKVREALEDAAALCDRFAERGMHPTECAGAIRAMIPTDSRPGQPYPTHPSTTPLLAVLSGRGTITATASAETVRGGYQPAGASSRYRAD